MSISIFDLFSIGIGPSSSHTVGPMRAAYRFVQSLKKHSHFEQTATIQVDLYGSLALTGKAHGTHNAVVLGLMGEEPATTDPEKTESFFENCQNTKSLNLNHERALSFDPQKNIKVHRRKNLPLHPNGMSFTAFDEQKNEIHKRIYYSVGGGFLVTDDADEDTQVINHKAKVANPFKSGTELLQLCKDKNKSIAQIVFENETAWRKPAEIYTQLDLIWDAMKSCIERGLNKPGILPGGLKAKRRANELYQKLKSQPEKNMHDPLSVLDWIHCYALAVSEENAAGGRVVTAPTNGAAGIIPAVLYYFDKLTPHSSEDKIRTFLLTAGAIAILYKINASISGAEVGCQGEVGVACSMAAAGLAAVKGGTPEQIENAAEIAMEHNLGLTCDPVGGLVQIPCIERNAMGAAKAVNAARMALSSDGNHMISLDRVIETMRQTGKDMMSKYKETSQGGLAINYVEC
ncbi:MAG: L-serine ammonia-lyase [Deltaproteobacteria bacterium]|nr:L-serine ammonia-lyase [Deltaproteobacteria bacterium]